LSEIDEHTRATLKRRLVDAPNDRLYSSEDHLGTALLAWALLAWWPQRMRVQICVLPNSGKSTNARTRKVPLILDRHQCTVLHAVVGIVNFTVLPCTLAGAAKTLENCEPEKGPCAQRRIVILQIDQGQALSVIGPSEPNDLPAQSVAAGSDLDPDALVRVQPDADRRLALCADRRYGKQREEQSVGKSTHDLTPI